MNVSIVFMCLAFILFIVLISIVILVVILVTRKGKGAYGNNSYNTGNSNDITGNQQTSSILICRNCGYGISQSWMFCPNCGTKKEPENEITQ